MPPRRTLALAVALATALAGGLAVAQTLTIRLDPTEMTSIAFGRAGLLEPEGYEVGYILEPPQHQEILLSCWTCAAAQFVEAGVTLVGTEVVEIRSRRPLNPAALIIRPGPAGPTTVWDVFIGRDPVPPPPSPEDIRQREAAVLMLLSRAQDALGVKGYTGGPVAVQVRAGADVMLRIVGVPAQYTYAVSGLGTPDLTESLTIQTPREFWKLTVQATLLEIHRETEGAEANTIISLRVGEDGWWQGDATAITFPGGLAGGRSGPGGRPQGGRGGGARLPGVCGELGWGAPGPAGPGMPAPPRLVIGDGHLGISGALRNVWPEAQEERCWNHKVLNVLEQLPRTQHRVAKTKLGAVAYAPTRAEAERKRREFEQWCSSTGTGRRRRRWGGTGTVW